MLEIPSQFVSIIKESAIMRRVPGMLLAALLYHESDFDPNARSENPDGSVDRGIAQINNKAWPDVSDAQAYDPKFAIPWCAQRLQTLHEVEGCRNWYEVCLAYNGGMGAVYAYREGKGYNQAYADRIFTTSRIQDIANEYQRAITALGNCWFMDALNRDFYHLTANQLRNMMGWRLES